MAAVRPLRARGATGADDAKLSSSLSVPTKPSDSSSLSVSHAAFFLGFGASALPGAAALAFGGFGAGGLRGRRLGDAESARGYNVNIPRRSSVS